MTTSIQQFIHISHPKSPKPKNDDDEVNDISQEHERVDVSGSPVLCVENIPEETLNRPVNALNTAEKYRIYEAN